MNDLVTLLFIQQWNHDWLSYPGIDVTTGEMVSNVTQQREEGKQSRRVSTAADG
jgi:hypothetical protein